MNVLDLRGPEFLQLYLVLFVIIIPAAMFLRHRLRQPDGGGRRLERPPTLHPLEVAYLAGGRRRIIDAAIAGLVQRGHLGVDNIRRKLTVGVAPDDATPLEDAIYEAVDAKAGNVARVRRGVADITRSATSRLQALGLALTDTDALRVRLVPSLPVVGLALLGFVKVLVGLTRHRPVGYLFVLLILTTVAAILFLTAATVRARLGDAALERLNRQHAALRTTASRAPNSLAGDDAAFAFALFGAGVFAWGPMADLRRTLAPPSEGGSGCGRGQSWTGSGDGGGGGSFSCSGGSSCGGGGSSCGGGGGCGGCGGGSS